MYTNEQKSEMYKQVAEDLTNAAAKLKVYSEDKDLFEGEEPSEEQVAAGRQYQQLVGTIGLYIVESKVNQS